MNFRKLNCEDIINELQEIELLEYRFLIIIRNELQEIKLRGYRFLIITIIIIITINDNNNMNKQKGLKGLWNQKGLG